MSQIYYNAFQWSTSSIIVVASLLDEMNLLNSKIGRLAIAASLIETTVFTAINTVASLGIIIRIVHNYYISVIVLSTHIAYILSVLYIARPITQWMVRKTPQGAQLSDKNFGFLIFMVLLFSFASTLIGINISFSLFFLGLMLPSGPPVGSTLVDRLEGIVTNLYFPIYVALIKMKFDFTMMMDYIKELKLVIFLDSITIIGKIIGIMSAAFFSARLSPRSIFTLTFIINTRGITELIIVDKNNDWASVDLMFPTLLMVVVTAMAIIAAPLVKILYDPSKRYKGHTRRTMMQHYFNDNIELRVVSCIHRQENVPPTVNILESLCIDNENPFCIYLLHLRELVGRITSVILPYKKIKTSPYATPATDIVVNAFTTFQDRKNGNNYKGIVDNNIHIPGADCVTVQPYVNVAPYTSMYDDICDLAISKKASMILVSFHRTIGFSGAVEEVSEDIRQVNLSVLKHFPCTVAILIDHGHNIDIDTALENTIHGIIRYRL
ncbi:hypothetical protein ZOSMA_13G00840 [Zostera marina]|uniref:Cation/H(+) antiporter central domain-containing protein n=1 Tax=Zostera marina TaxID=29655 RepID=A0A0K9Q097_ZOSMR|nr:hypothetical protein ZOSMA_13G00840 [Zostera marina]